MSGPARLERGLVVLVALHSACVGLALLFLTRWGVIFGGWSQLEPAFFARQAGAFHLVVAAAYLIEYFRYRGVTILLIAKATAVGFLLAMWAIDGGPWAVPLSALGDLSMGALVLFLHRRVLAEVASARQGPPRR